MKGSLVSKKRKRKGRISARYLNVWNVFSTSLEMVVPPPFHNKCRGFSLEGERTLLGLHVSAFELEQTKCTRTESRRIKRLTYVYVWSQLQIHIN